MRYYRARVDVELGNSCTPDLLTTMDKVMADNQGILGNIIKMYFTVQQASNIMIHCPNA